jgi:hypothetical protein
MLQRTITASYPGALNPFYQPEDAYAGELLASESQMRAGVTTAVDLW